MSGAGKSTLTYNVKSRLIRNGHHVEVIDGDDYRKELCRDLKFSKEDRIENIKRLAFVASKLSAHGIITIISAINPYEEVRQEVKNRYQNVRTAFIDCGMDTLVKRDTKGLYAKALLPDNHPQKLTNLTGINDPFDRPEHPDLYINSGQLSVREATDIFYNFIVSNWNLISSRYD
jgi:adenylylsulfate kinase